MPRIFICYRRVDSKSHADNVYDGLVKAFGEDGVRRDIDDIPFGVDFRQHLSNEIASFDVVLVLIGRIWASVRDDFGRKLIDNPADMVRLQVETALQQHKIVVPVLVDGGAMPIPDELAPSLHELCYRRAIQLQSGTGFQRDLRRLVEGLRTLANNAPPSPPPATQATPEPAPTPQPTPQPPVAPPQSTPPPAAPTPPAPEPAPAAPEPPAAATPEPEPEPVAPQAPEIPRSGAAAILPPPFAWVEIPAGTVTIQEGAFHQKTIYVDAFQISRYPVTNAQFQRFVEAANGYSLAAWWEYSPQAAQWREANPDSQATGFSGDDVPQTNVNWYTALAFCRWLSAQVSELEGRDIMITLPREEQWQRAAQGDDLRTLPWGDQLDPNRCNFNSRRVTPVTQYPAGASPFGVMDLIGNVAEWCLAAHDSTGDPFTPKRSLLHGGSWGSSSPAELRIGARLWLAPDFWNGSSGFRIVRL